MVYIIIVNYSQKTGFTNTLAQKEVCKVTFVNY
jgi:hypothetical protein